MTWRGKRASPSWPRTPPCTAITKMERHGDQRDRHPRSRRLRRRGGARAVHGGRGAAAGRRVRGPAAPDPVRAAQGAGRTSTGDSRGQQDGPARRAHRRGGPASHDLLLDVASDLDDEAAKAAEHALGLPTLYASGRAGIASTEQPADGEVPPATTWTPCSTCCWSTSRRRSGTPRRRCRRW